MPITLDGSNGITTPTYGGADTSEYLVPVTQFKNRIINGACVIDQRNAGASTNNANAAEKYSVDRWNSFGQGTNIFSMQQNAGSVTPPAGFINYLGITSLAATTISNQNAIYQPIEGLNVADLGFGTANAQTVTLSFWVRSSLTGTFGGSLRNSAANRSYPFSFVINAANTWEQKSVTIAGDTTGTWLTNNGVGIYLTFDLGSPAGNRGTAGSWSANNFVGVTGAQSIVATNGATFYITGVQLEVGSTATSFDYRPYGTELALCQRYCVQILGRETGSTASDWAGLGASLTSTFQVVPIQVPVTMRSATGQSLVLTSAVSNYSALNGAGNPVTAGSINLDTPSVHCPVINIGVASGLTVGQTGGFYTTNSSNKAFITSEL